jgi:hypothetical protein
MRINIFNLDDLGQDLLINIVNSNHHVPDIRASLQRLTNSDTGFRIHVNDSRLTPEEARQLV